MRLAVPAAPDSLVRMLSLAPLLPPAVTPAESVPRRPRRHVAAQALAAVALLLSLSACQQPTPRVSVFAGSSEQSVEAACWNAEDAPAEAGCVRSLSQDQIAAREGVIKVHPGETIGISVDTALADAGWAAQIGQSTITPDRVDSTYYRFMVSEQDLANAPFELRIYAFPAQGDTPRGLWLFRLERA